MNSRGIKLPDARLILQHFVGPIPGRIQQVRSPRGITLEIRIGHSFAAPV